MSSSPSDISFLNLPRSAVLYLRRKNRQDSRWTYRQALTNVILKLGLRVFTGCHAKPSLSLKPRLEGERFAVVEPARPELYTGVALDKQVKPETIGGTWFPRPFSAEADLAEDRHIILHFHGGSYVLGDGRTSSCRFLAKCLLAHTPSAFLFSIQYRLACHPGCRWPAQLQDAISSYSYLIHTLGIPASRIVLSGDSSGAHLALALLRYVTQFNDPSLLPAPKCGWIFSPWCDVPAAEDPAVWNNSPNYKTECIPASFPTWGAKHFLGDLEITQEIEEYVVPIRHSFIVPAPVLIVTGELEVLCEEHKELARVFASLPGNASSVDFFVEELVPHDVFMVGWILGFKKEAHELAAKAGGFLSRLPGELSKGC